MQYKIPVQIENEDPILLGLSLKQLGIIMGGFGIAYGLFKSLEPSTGAEIAAIPAIFIVAVTLFVALFKQYEMTFLPFILAILRFNINFKERSWKSGIDSFSALDIGIIVQSDTKKEDIVDMKTKAEKIQSLEDNLLKI
ncbi:MAG: PrgI family protein [Candidatus Altimarinota bacterium]